MVKKIIYRYGHIIAAFAFAFVSINANRHCVGFLHDPKMPESAKKFRKF